jgi:HAD superfamily hydrolase (TIGR01509 family)
MKIKGLIFDFDGLILDTEYAEFKSWEMVLASYQVNFPMEDWLSCIGISEYEFDIYKYLETHADKKLNRDDVLSARESYLGQLLATQSILPGVEELIIEAKNKGLKLAVASGASNKWVTSNLKRIGLINYFDGIHTREEVAHAKPDPALYNNAIKNLGISPECAVAFEDSPNGIRAAKAAGLFCVAVPNYLTKMLDTSAADVILPTLKDVGLSQINTFLEKQTSTIA